MNILVSSVVLSAFFLGVNHSLASDVGDVCGADAPSVKDLTKDPDPRFGLNIKAVKERQTACRVKGVGNDVSSHIMLIMGNKQKIRDIINKKVKIMSSISGIEANLRAERSKSRQERNQTNISGWMATKAALEKKLLGMDATLKALMMVTADQGANLKEILKLKDEQIANIPAMGG